MVSAYSSSSLMDSWWYCVCSARILFSTSATFSGVSAEWSSSSSSFILSLNSFCSLSVRTWTDFTFS